MKFVSQFVLCISWHYYVFINCICTWGGIVEHHFYMKWIQIIHAKGKLLSS